MDSCLFTVRYRYSASARARARPVSETAYVHSVVTGHVTRRVSQAAGAAAGPGTRQCVLCRPRRCRGVAAGVRW